MKRIAGCRSELLAASVSDSMPRNVSLPTTLCAAIALAAAGLGISPNAGASNIWYVTTTGDPGPAGTQSLRQAVALAGPGDEVRFDAALAGSTITLLQGQIAINRTMSIFPDSGRLTISGQHNGRVFIVYNTMPNTTVKFVIAGVSLIQGSASECGGAIYAFGLPGLPGGPAAVEVQAQYVDVSDNSAKNGGALCFLSAHGVVYSSRVTGNHADNSGGGIYTRLASYLKVDKTTISGNSAGYQGGGIYSFGNADLRVQYSLISGNSIPEPGGPGDQGGGGIAIANGSKTLIKNSTITANFAYAGGAGIRFLDASSANTANVKFTTIVGNAAGGHEAGNGIVAIGGVATINSSIVANNFSRDGGNDDLAGAFTADYNLIKNIGSANVTGIHNHFGLDPQLSLLADHGGPTLTLLPAVDSPAIDGGCGCNNQLIDQRFFARDHYPPDAGAVERQYPEDIIFRTGFDSS